MAGPLLFSADTTMRTSHHAMSGFNRRRVERRRHRSELRPIPTRAVVASKPHKFKRKHHWGRFLLRTLTVVAVLGTVIGGFILFRALTATEEIRIQVLGAEGKPLSGAVVTTDSGHNETTIEGGLANVPFEVPGTLTVTARGYRSATYTVEQLPRQGAL